MANKAVKYPYRKKLTDWIQNYYIRCGWDKNDINWNMITAQIKNMEDKYNYTDLGLLYTMWFMSSIKDIYLLNDCDNGSILNLIPFYYDSAQTYYKRDKELEKIYSEYDFKDEIRVIDKSDYVQERKKLNIDFD